MATLKRKKSDGTWETVATPSDFPVQIPVEIVDADLTTLSVTQNGTYNPSPHDGYSSVSVNVPTGTTVQTESGSFTSNTSGNYSVSNLGFTPDLVTIYYGSSTDSGTTFYQQISFPYTEHSTSSTKRIQSDIFVGDSTILLVSIDSYVATNIFAGTAAYLDGSLNYHTLNNETFQYVAYKWTE